MTQVRNALQQTTNYTYDSCLGKPTSSTDRNGKTTTYDYTDPLDRLKMATFPAVPVGEESYQPTTVYTYNDSDLNVVKAQDLNVNDGAIQTKTVYDGLGRVIQTQLMSDPEGIVYTDTIYDALGRKKTVSNPYRSTSDATYGLTTYDYDALSRVRLVTRPDGAQVQTFYSGNSSTVCDEANKQRRSFTDALGRLKSVDEMNTNETSPCPITDVYATTSYDYDALDNLVHVTQGSQQRFFMYDSLKRLIRSYNPEQDVNTSLALTDPVTGNSQWSMSYSYDSNGNLTAKTDSRGVGTSYTYDGLNRLTYRTYSNVPTGVVWPPAVTYKYDTVPTTPTPLPPTPYNNTVGHLTQVTSSDSTTYYANFDPMGRVLTSEQITSGQAYTLAYGYDLAGNLKSQTYPSGRVVTTNYNTASRVTLLSGQKSGSDPIVSYAFPLAYWPHGAINSMRLGNGLTESTGYRGRLQLESINLGSAASLGYTYHADDPTKNNGNIIIQTLTVGANTIQQRYGYDSVNRLTSVYEDSNGTAMWNHTYGYDPYGNQTSGSSSSPDYIPVLVLAIDPLTNRLVVTGTNYTYDHAGNLTQEPVGANLQTYAYDAEGRLAKVNNTAGVYTYDGEGRRVKKVDGASNTIFVYNAMGQMVAEYTNTAPSGNGGTSYLLADHLGSTRVVTDASGNVIARHDYLPFGGEIPSFLGARSLVTAYKAFDSTRQRFTGKERDTETGLDYFGARYYGSNMGRFTSTDPKMISWKRMVDPQQWNMYSYGRNNPITMIDPDGREVRIATQELQKSFDHLMKSSKFSSAVAPFQGKGKPDLIIQRGQLPNDRIETERPTLGLTKSSIVPSIQNCSSATDCSTIPAKLKEATVTIDDRVKEGTGKEQIDGVLGHEISHVNDSEKDPQGSIDETNRNANQKHDDRSEEQRADQFSNDVRKEVKQEEKREKKEKKENPD